MLLSGKKSDLFEDHVCGLLQLHFVIESVGKCFLITTCLHMWKEDLWVFVCITYHGWRSQINCLKECFKQNGAYKYSMELDNSSCLTSLTCKNSTGLSCQVNLVLPGDAQHHDFGPLVVLGGQQPAQRLREKPAEPNKSIERKDMKSTHKEGWEQMCKSQKKKQTESEEEDKQ